MGVSLLALRSSSVVDRQSAYLPANALAHNLSQRKKSHAAPVQSAHFIKRRRNLPKRADANGVDQHGKDVAVVDHGLLQALGKQGANHGFYGTLFWYKPWSVPGCSMFNVVKRISQTQRNAGSGLALTHATDYAISYDKTFTH